MPHWSIYFYFLSFVQKIAFRLLFSGSSLRREFWTEVDMYQKLRTLIMIRVFSKVDIYAGSADGLNLLVSYNYKMKSLPYKVLVYGSVNRISRIVIWFIVDCKMNSKSQILNDRFSPDWWQKWCATVDPDIIIHENIHIVIFLQISSYCDFILKRKLRKK